MITLENWISSSGKYPDRAKSEELTDEIKKQAEAFLAVLNDFLEELTPEVEYKVSSGFRPSSVNSKLPNAAKKSLHMTGLALDIEDPNNELDKLIQSKPELLEKYGLWLEHPDSTPKWSHIDKSTRTQRKIRIFHP